MPITKTEFYTAVEERVKELMRQIHAFLAKNKEQAYSEAERFQALRVPSDADSDLAFREALRALDGIEAVQWGIIKGEDYYIYNQDVEAVWPES